MLLGNIGDQNGCLFNLRVARIQYVSYGAVLPEYVQCKKFVPTSPVDEGEVEGGFSTQVGGTGPLEREGSSEKLASPPDLPWGQG